LEVARTVISPAGRETSSLLLLTQELVTRKRIDTLILVRGGQLIHHVVEISASLRDPLLLFLHIFLGSIVTHGDVDVEVDVVNVKVDRG
jgi:hypothetical protein